MGEQAPTEEPTAQLARENELKQESTPHDEPSGIAKMHAGSGSSFEAIKEGTGRHTYPEGTKIGILSDSHGRVEMTRRAVEILVNVAQVDVVVHLGDFGEPEVLDALSGLGRPVHVVFGNVDFNRSNLTNRAGNLGLIVDDPVGELRVGLKSIFFTHGHNFSVEQHALASRADFLLHGHTHEVRDERIDSTRILNPGALFRASRYNVMVLDPTADRVRLIDVPRG